MVIFLTVFCFLHSCHLTVIETKRQSSCFVHMIYIVHTVVSLGHTKKTGPGMAVPKCQNMINIAVRDISTVCNLNSLGLLGYCMCLYTMSAMQLTGLQLTLNFMRVLTQWLLMVMLMTLIRSMVPVLLLMMIIKSGEDSQWHIYSEWEMCLSFIGQS